MLRFEDGHLHVGRVRGIPVRVHWATPLGALLLGGLKVQPVTWALFAALVLLHELAHAAAARALSIPVYSADLTAWGGQCLTGYTRSQLHVSLVAAAGPAVHVVLFVAATILLRSGISRLGPGVGVPVSKIGEVNFYLALLNLVPLRPLDGAEAWKLVPIALRRAGGRVHGAALRARLAWLDWRLERSARRARRAGLHVVPHGDDVGGDPPKWLN